MKRDRERGQVMPFVMGTRWDLMPVTPPDTSYTHICAFCQATTYTESEFPEGTTVVCNRCAASTTQMGDADPHTLVVWDLPPDLLGSLLQQADQRGIALENSIIGFLEWKTGRELSEIRLFNREDKQIYIVRKRPL
jgi:hypothetical protein